MQKDSRCARCNKWFDRRVMKYYGQKLFCPSCLSHDKEIHKKVTQKSK